jgi:3-hydroxyacyl-CoA dehydrogenase/enoyl-CoA hydratase/3-hydroxybutyryl-CoA epimerase
MGGGIAWLLGYRAGSVRLKDVVWPSIAKGLKTAHDIYLELVKKRKVTTQEVSMMMHRLSGGLDWVGFANTDVVIEAIVEDMTIKKTVLQELEAEVSDTTIIASNTSGLSITEMGSVLSRPDRFIGMHFFSPVHRMPLVEVIRGEQTSDETVAHIVALSKQLKKTPIVVKNGPGFLVNRILIPYVNEAVRLLEDGVDVERIDRLATSFGMPIGPLALADEVGLDVGYKVAKQLEVGYGDRMSVASSFEAIHRVQGMLGKKTGRGFYVHSGKSKRPNDQLASMIVKNFSAQVTDEECIDRLILVMVNESARCLDERVVDNPSYLDMAMILGTGFPAFRGGVTRYADERGLSTIEDALRRLSVKFGKRFEPAPLISQLVAGGRGFEDWAVSQKENR